MNRASLPRADRQSQTTDLTISPPCPYYETVEQMAGNEREKFSQGKRALELLGIEHEAVIENIVLTEETSKALLVNLGIDFLILEKDNEFVLKEIFNDEKFFGSVKNKDEFIKDWVSGNGLWHKWFMAVEKRTE